MTRKTALQQTDKSTSGHHLASCNNRLVSSENKISLPQVKQLTDKRNVSVSSTKAQAN